MFRVAAAYAEFFEGRPFWDEGAQSDESFLGHGPTEWYEGCSFSVMCEL